MSSRYTSLYIPRRIWSVREVAAIYESTIRLGGITNLIKRMAEVIGLIEFKNRTGITWKMVVSEIEVIIDRVVRGGITVRVSKSEVAGIYESLKMIRPRVVNEIMSIIDAPTNVIKKFFGRVFAYIT